MFARIADVYRRTRKPKDLLWNRFVARPLAAVVLVPLQATRVTPNQVTLGTLVLFVAAAAVLALDGRWVGLLIGVGLLELAYVFDCVDGQLARLRGTSTPIGAHLDFLMDELKAFLLVAAVAVRLWRGDPGEARDHWLLEGLLALVAVASAISLTTFLRRPEYAASTGAVVGQGRGDYSGGVKAPEGTGSAAPPAAPAGEAEPPRGSALSPKRLIEAAGSFVVHYPSYIVFVAIFDRMDVFLHAYLLVNAAHVGRSLLGITWKLGRRAP